MASEFRILTPFEIDSLDLSSTSSYLSANMRIKIPIVNRFTLVELLVVIAIIAILAGMLLPALKGAKNKAQESTCLSNLRQINLQITSYEIDHAGTYPPSNAVSSWGDGTGWMNLISVNAGDRKIYRCPVERRRDFSYSLNCREPYVRTDPPVFSSWRSVELDRAKNPSAFILVEESSNTWFVKNDCDQDNYTQNVNSFMTPEPNHEGERVPMLYLDGHCEVERSFDVNRMTYFTDVMKPWQ